MAKKRRKLTKEEWNGLLEKLLLEECGAEDTIDVSVSMSVTINIGDYESLKYGMAMSAKCKQSHSRKMKEAMEEVLEEEMRRKYKEIKSQVRKAKPEMEAEAIDDEVEIEID